LIFRPAVAADVPVLRAMLQALADGEGGNYPVASEDALLTHGFGPRPLFRAVIAEAEVPLGMAIYYPDFSTHRGEPGVYVQDIYVAPEARGSGLGQRLLAEVMAQQDFGARYMTLMVGPANTAAQRFYHRLGFRSRGYDCLILDGENLEALR
jgi:ribosomal protein S18 acetylase RimI-like enzyme